MLHYQTKLLIDENKYLLKKIQKIINCQKLLDSVQMAKKQVFLGKRPAFSKYSPVNHHAIRIDDQIWNLDAPKSLPCLYKFKISTESIEDYQWTLIGDCQNQIKYLADEINKSINQYHLIYENCQIIAEIVLHYVIGKRTLKQAIAIFQKVKQCRSMETVGLVSLSLQKYFKSSFKFLGPIFSMTSTIPILVNPIPILGTVNQIVKIQRKTHQINQIINQ